MVMKRFANSAETTLTTPVGGAPTDTAISVFDAVPFPLAGDFYIRVDDELMLVTAVAGPNWTVVRGEEGTSRVPHSSGAPVVQVLTAGVMNALAVLTGDPGADRILFWDQSAGQTTWLTAGAGLAIAGTTLVATGGTGTVTSVGLTVPPFLSVLGSPVTTNGTLAVSLATQGANTVFAGPTTGGAVAPGFRALVTDDLPALNGFTDADPALADVVPVYDASASANRDMRVDHLLGLLRVAPGGRLTLASGAPVTAGDITGATTVYCTPYASDVMVLWDGTRWVPVQFAEVSLALGTVTSGVPYDVFGYLSSGALALEKFAWLNAAVTVTVASPGVVAWNAHGMSNGDPVVFTTTGSLPTGLSANTTYYVVSSTTNTFQVAATPGGSAVNTTGTQSGTHTAWQSRRRGTAVTIQDGRYCKSGDKTRLYLGTFCTTSTTTTEDSRLRRFLWNMYNRRPKHLFVTDTTDQWPYATAAWRGANASNSNRVQLVRGLDEDAVTANVNCSAYSSVHGLRSVAVGVGVNSTSVNSAQTYGFAYNVQGAGAAFYAGYPPVGYCYLQWLEFGDADNNFLGDLAGVAAYQSGLTAEGMF